MIHVCSTVCIYIHIISYIGPIYTFMSLHKWLLQCCCIVIMIITTGKVVITTSTQSINFLRWTTVALDNLCGFPGLHGTHEVSNVLTHHDEGDSKESERLQQSWTIPQFPQEPRDEIGWLESFGKYIMVGTIVWNSWEPEAQDFVESFRIK